MTDTNRMRGAVHTAVGEIATHIKDAADATYIDVVSLVVEAVASGLRRSVVDLEAEPELLKAMGDAFRDAADEVNE